MPEVLPSISARHVALYLACPRRFCLSEIEGRQAPYRGVDALAAVLEPMVYAMLNNRDMSAEEMRARYDAEWAGIRPLMQRRGTVPVQVLETMGKRMIAHFRALELPAIDQAKLKPRFEREAEVEGQKIKIIAEASIEEKAQLGHLRISMRNWSRSQLLSDIEVLLAAYCANSYNAYVVSFATTTESVGRSSIRGFGNGVPWSLVCAAEAKRGIEAGYFPPCNPQAEECGSVRCRWIGLCGKKRVGPESQSL
jgi:hypothetical protein